MTNVKEGETFGWHLFSPLIGQTFSTENELHKALWDHLLHHFKLTTPGTTYLQLLEQGKVTKSIVRFGPYHVEIPAPKTEVTGKVSSE